MGQSWRVFKLKTAFRVRAFAGARGGNVAIIYALCAAVLMGLLGITIDFTRAQTLRAQMQNAADGAALVAERSSNLPLSQRKTLAQAYFNAEMGNRTPGADFDVVELASGGHRATAGYTMPLSLAAIVKNDPWRIEVAAEAEAQASPPIEVALALDNTGSMANDMGTLRQGAEDLANYLLSIDGDTVSVGLVPFVAQVNIGTSNTAWVDTTGLSPQNGVLLEGRLLGYRSNSTNANCFDATVYPTTYGGYPVRWIRGNASYPLGYTNTSRCYAFSPENVNMYQVSQNMPSSAQWGGCVEARLPPYDIDDTAPSASTPATLFTPYFSLDDGGDQSGNNEWISNTSYDRTNQLGISGSPTYRVGDNTTATQNPLRTWGVYKYRSGVPVSVSTSNTNGYGPNRGCPTPIVPLTTDKSTVVNAIRGMLHWNGGGTNQIEGLSWAWRVLSPGQPFTQGRPYNDPNDPVRKVIVLFTDGDNTSLSNGNSNLLSDYAALNYRALWQNWQTTDVPHLAVDPTTHAQTVTWSDALPSTYQRSGLTSSSAIVSDMNSRQLQLCTAIKNTGIEIYTVGFRITAGATADNLLRSCATQDGAHFYHADSQAELLQVFAAIGSGIGQLRVTR